MAMLLSYGGGRGTHKFNLDIDVTSLPSRREALVEISQPVAGVHGLAKGIESKLVAKALKNEPFEDYPRAVYAWKRAQSEGEKAGSRFDQVYRGAVEGFLRQAYNSLTFIPEISFDIANVSEDEEREALNAAYRRYHASNMGNQADSLKEAYIGLQALRTVFAHVSKYTDLSIETVVPSRYLPELLMAAPVWFIEKGRPIWLVDPLEKWRKRMAGTFWGDRVFGMAYSENEVVRYFCKLGATDAFAHLFQMYNRLPRRFSEFTGRDVMPLPIVDLMRQVKGSFDYLVIATPYHDLASTEWMEERLKQIKREYWESVDPFLFGFLKQVPEIMFFLGRWSGTGIFPLVVDMIAETIDHIRRNKQLLLNFNARTSWYKGGRMWHGMFNRITETLDSDRKVVGYAENLLRAFDGNYLFPWLRGETDSKKLMT